MQLWTAIIEAGKSFLDDDGMQHAAALAFYTVLSLAPLLLLVTMLASSVWSEATVDGAVVEQFESVIGSSAAQQVQAILRSGDGGESTTTALGVAVLLVGATGVFGQLKKALNRMWNVRTRRQGWKRLLRTRFLSLLAVLGLALLFIVSLLLSTGVDAFAEWFGGLLGVSSVVVLVLNVFLTFALFMFIFAASFKVLPDAVIAWRDALFGAAVTAVLFILGKSLLSVYLANSSLSSAYGAAGALVVILVWTYYAGIVYFYGAELTQVYLRRKGRSIQPGPAARKV